jgi:hypothetical protein
MNPINELNEQLGATPGERVMRDCEAKRNMTNTGLEKRRPNNEEELPVGLLHDTSGQSEDIGLK